MDNYLPLSLSGVRKQNTDNRSYSRNPIPRLRLKLSTKTMWTNFCFEMYTKRTCLFEGESVNSFIHACILFSKFKGNRKRGKNGIF